MNEAHSQLASEIRSALAQRQSPMDAAIRAWERITGSRGGLNDALVTLADEGILQGEVSAGSTGVRRVMKIVSISADEGILQGEVSAGSTGVRRVMKIVSISGEAAVMESAEKVRTVFVVHGRDLDLRRAMCEFLRAIDLQPLEWLQLTSQAPNATPYIGDLLDKAFELAQAIVILFTPDEEARLVERLGKEAGGFQARPNVLFEAGLALGRNPNRSVVVEVGALRPFSDLGRRVAGPCRPASFAPRPRQCHRGGVPGPTPLVPLRAGYVAALPRRE